MPKPSKKIRVGRHMIRNKNEWEANPPTTNRWVTFAIGSDRYGYPIEYVSENKKEVKTKHGLHLILNKWYQWMRIEDRRKIMYDHGIYYISDVDMSYRDPHF